MTNGKRSELKIRGLTQLEIDYLKSLAKKKRAQELYVAHLENMKLASDHIQNQVQKQTEQLDNFNEKMNCYGDHISRWLEYEGEVECDD